jgi:hypothetical protein
LARTRLSPVSAKRRSQRDERAEVVAKLGPKVCELVGWGDCGGPFDPHEVVARGARPGAELEGRLVIWLCRRHHREITDDPVIGEKVGARVESWAFDRWDEAVLTEAAARRATTRASGRVPDVERWRNWEP